ncbi:uncharacterized protein LOC134533798 [Bacillus rossius redtenbacheri]|uniref:uncharacterized protein LOC134533798 n=1 Tax=Bacillus rossius redtenbacheri TaxID=93214 RepID=UPI002FDCDA2E
MELGNKPICCPVCTLYMREGVTLQSHLDTHPKEKVIEALVKFSCLKESDVQETPDFLRNVQSALPSASRAATSQCITSSGGNCLSPGRSSVSTNINYQQFLSNEGTCGSTVLPQQHIPVSTLLSGSEVSCGSSAPYNPFLLQQQHIQIITAKTSSGTQPIVHHRVPAAYSKQFPHVTTSVSSPVAFQATSFTHSPSPTPTPFTSQARFPPSVNPIGRTSSPPIKVYSDAVTSFAEVFPDSFSQSTLLSAHKTHKQLKTMQDNSNINLNTQTVNKNSCRNTLSKNNSIEVNEKVHMSVCSKNSKGINCGTEIIERSQISNDVRNSISRNNSTDSNERIQISEHVFGEHLLMSLANDKVRDASGKEIAVEILEFTDKPEHVLTSCDGILDKIKLCGVGNKLPRLGVSDVNIQDQPEVPATKETVHQASTEANQDIVLDCSYRGTHEDCLENSELVHSDCDTLNVFQPSSPESLLRVRNDLSCSVKSFPSASCSSSFQLQGIEEERQHQEEHLEDPELMMVASSPGCIIQVFSTQDEYITSDNINGGKERFLQLGKMSSEAKDGFAKLTSDCNVASESTSGNVNVITFDCVGVPADVGGSPGRAGYHTDSSSSDSHVITELTAVPPEDLRAEPDVTTMDIQTDEMMPPKGELSEQESVGGNDSSLWAPVTRVGDDVCASYDLLARESWEASDGSDGEGNEIFSPSISEKLHIERTGSEAKVSKSSSSRAARKPKAPEVAKTYLCITCDKIFNCPKERRVHQRLTHHGEGGSRVRTVPKRTCSKKWEGETKSKTVKSEKKDVENKILSEDSDFTKFEEVFIVKTEARDERDEEEAGEVHRANSCKSETQPAIKSSEGKSCVDSKGILIKESHQCSLCEKMFATLKLLRTHTRNSHFTDKMIKLTCRICSKRFVNETLMQAHFKIHPLECTQCGKYFYRRQNFKLHLKRHLKIRPYRCDICDKSFVTRQKLGEHTNIHTGNSPFKCSLCDETFRRYSNLIGHRNRCHLKIKRKVKDYVCHCGEIFHTKKKLEWHKETHDTKPKSCLCCSEKYVHETSLTRHIRKAHDGSYMSKRSPDGKQEPCSVCNGMLLKSSLPTHMRIHTGLKPYACPVCSKQFTTKWNLSLHRWTHASRSSKPFKCSLCKSAFFRQNDYKSHMHAHRNVRPYTCNHCGCQFIRKYNCQRHVREHERNKAFSCTLCGKLFHRKYYLTEHMRVHSGTRPFACHICGKASSTKSNHNKHVRIHHAREPVNTEG